MTEKKGNRESQKPNKQWDETEGQNKFYCPALKEESRNKPARIMPLKENEPLLNWLKRTNRLLTSDRPDKSHDNDVPSKLEGILGISISDLEEEEEEDDDDDDE